MATITIDISLGGPNGIAVDPPKPKAQRGDDVEWKCVQGQNFMWAVEFNPIIDTGTGNATPHRPFPKNGFNGGPTNTAVGGTVKGDADFGHYRYTVAAWDGNEVLMLDPDLDIVG